MTKITQNSLILKHLQENGKIDPLTSLNLYGCFRLGARIYDLKQDGHQIETKRKKNGSKRSTFAEYIYKGDGNKWI
jgi:hypothetical protein